MLTIDTTASLREQIAEWRRNSERVAFVPTMGNLHAGHLHLVSRARALAAHTVVSIFVNPLQFGPSEDFQNYPRSFQADSTQLSAQGVDILFAPGIAQMYPQGTETMTRVEVPALANILCGLVRPGHFTGVATVVTKLFNIVQPDVALFGEKDYQQLLVIRRVVSDLCLPLEIVGVPTVRETDGLAMSSRNSYLSEDERARAPSFYQTLCAVVERLRHGADDYADLEANATRALRDAGFRPDYVSIRRRQDLAEPTLQDDTLIVMGAAWLGKTRLIDNVQR